MLELRQLKERQKMEYPLHNIQPLLMMIQHRQQGQNLHSLLEAINSEEIFYFALSR